MGIDPPAIREVVVSTPLGTRPQLSNLFIFFFNIQDPFGTLNEHSVDKYIQFDV